LLRAALRRHTVRNAIQVSVVVGTVLNAINQGPLLWHDEPISWLQILMNYVVPYCVASYSAARNELKGGAERRRTRCNRTAAHASNRHGQRGRGG